MSGTTRIIVNKHYDVASAITAGAFTTLSSATNDYKKGEIIVSNEPENEGLYIMNTLGQVVPASAKIDYDKIEAIIKKYINHVYLTPAQYDDLVARGMIDEECTYFVYEDSGYTPTPTPVPSGDTMVVPFGELDGDGVFVIQNAKFEDGALVFFGGGSPSPTPTPTPIPEDDAMIFPEGTKYEPEFNTFIIPNNSIVIE